MFTAACCFPEKKLSRFLMLLWYLLIAIAWLVELWSCEDVRSRNTINTKMHICFLVANGNKKKKCKACSSFFYQPFGYTNANFESLTRRQPQSLIIITTLFQVRPVGSHSMTESISGILAGNHQILNVTCFRTVSLTPKEHQKQMII